MRELLDTVVIGAGQAGLGCGYWLQQDRRRFVILERGRIGETWRAQRWDSFALNTPNWANTLPGAPYDGPQPDGFWHRDELVTFFERYVATFDLPVHTETAVTALGPAAEGGFEVQTDQPQMSPLRARTVVVASGRLQTPKFPSLRSLIPASVVQLHSADYRSAEALPPGAVVVVGSGQSGCQITEDLAAAGRTVYLCTSRVARAPRRYRGRDIIDWWHDMGFLDASLEELEDPSVARATQPQISGLGRQGHTVSLQQLERDGVHLLGRLVDVDNGALITDDQLAEHIRFADERSAAFKRAIDDYLVRIGAEPPAQEADPADLPAEPGLGDDAPTRLDLEASGVGTIIWCTGFTANFGWIGLPVLDGQGVPLHRHGVTRVPGFYFLGFPWLRSRKSGLIMGVADDARHIASLIRDQLG